VYRYINIGRINDSPEKVAADVEGNRSGLRPCKNACGCIYDDHHPASSDFQWWDKTNNKDSYCSSSPKGNMTWITRTIGHCISYNWITIRLKHIKCDSGKLILPLVSIYRRLLHRVSMRESHFICWNMNGNEIPYKLKWKLSDTMWFKKLNTR